MPLFKHLPISVVWVLIVSSFISFSPLVPAERAWAADYEPTSDCIGRYIVEGYSKDKDLRLKAGANKLVDRTWEALRTEFGKTDPTLEPSRRWDLIPHNALVKPLIDPQEAAVAQMLAIRRAKHNVTIGTYIFGKDPYAYALLQEVKDAIGRGVDVDILVDAEGTPDLHHDQLKALHSVPRGKAIDDLGNQTDRDAKVTTVLFNPPSNAAKFLPTYLKHVLNLHNGLKSIKSASLLFTRRMHTKIAGVDMDYPEGIAFLGGRNKDGLYYGYEKVGPRTYNDTELMIRNDPSDFGPGKKTLSSTIAREFRKLYGHLLNQELLGLMKGVDDPQYQKEVDKMSKASQDMWKPDGDYDKILHRMEADKFLDTGFDRASTRFLTEIENINRESAWVDPNETGEKNLISITKNLDHFSKQADKGITIVTPYPNMTAAERKGIIDKMIADPDFKFTLVTNSLYSGDNIITQYVVDHKLIPTLKKEAKDAALKSGLNEADADLFVKRFKIYALGRMDGVLFGGTKFYGKLHAKFAQFFSKDSSKTKTVAGSYNGDNISRLHNAEVAVSVYGEGVTSEAFEKKTRELIDGSYEWGSPEWLQLRNSKQLKKKRIIEAAVKHLERFFDPLE